MDADRISQALARIEAASARIEAAAARPASPDPAMQQKYEHLRSEAEHALEEIDALIGTISS